MRRPCRHPSHQRPRPPPTSPLAATATGANHYAVAWRMAAAGWIGCAIAPIARHLRPSPYGGAFLLEWRDYIIRPLLYELLAVWLIALPFLLFWLTALSPAAAEPGAAAGPLGARGADGGQPAAHRVRSRALPLSSGCASAPASSARSGEPTTLADPFLLNILADDRGGPSSRPCSASSRRRSIRGGLSARSAGRLRDRPQPRRTLHGPRSPSWCCRSPPASSPGRSPGRISA